MKVKVVQLCLTLCHPMDYTVHGILQARTLECSLSLLQGIFPTQEIKPASPALQADSLLPEAPGSRSNRPPAPVFLPRESSGQRSLVGYHLWGHTESDTTEATQHACIYRKRKWQPTPVFLPRESCGQRSLVGCHLWVINFAFLR